jgi:hypothetical protein
LHCFGENRFRVSCEMTVRHLRASSSLQLDVPI